MDKGIERKVRRRARGRCEYCRLPESVSELPHWIDHIVPQQHEGPDDLSNLALCCARCNRHKGPNLAGLDPTTGKIVRLFHPRNDRWAEHFKWDGALLVGLGPIGRVTVKVLAINLPLRVPARRALIESGDFRPT